jgi:hypothetical protein
MAPIALIALGPIRRSAMLLLIVLFLLSCAIAATPPRCKGNPELVSACYVIHGRATYGNGTPALRIWPVGTRRMLGVTSGRVADDADDPIVPQKLNFDSSKEAFGDFEVCPFTAERKGAMQMVCVESVKNFSIR